MAVQSKWVTIRHPKAHGDNGPTATATREAFNIEWKKKGWIIVGDAEGPIPVPGAEELADQDQESSAEQDLSKPTPITVPNAAELKKEGN